ncbi:MAG: T9SS type A sorting domain-containing protein [Draconibacterium sp.]|nr:T9SS type A sorting domain-containing protein [Draconibacterium sp.]
MNLKNGTISGIGEKQFAELTLFPNPANQKLNFKTGGITHFDEIAIVNIAGKEVLCEKQVSITQGIDVSQLMNGIYFVRVKSDSRISIRKIIVKH